MAMMELRFKIREAPEGWWLFFEELAWGPFATRDEAIDLSQDMIATLKKQFPGTVEGPLLRRNDKELMPWVKPKHRH
jgi:hypothetical protein